MSYTKAILAAAFIAIGSAASATTVSFNVVVTESNFSTIPIMNPPMATLPALGQTGMVSISLPGRTAADMTPLGNPDAPPNAGSVAASVTVGSLSGALEPGFGSVTFVNDTIMRFSNGSFSSINVSFPRDAGATPTYAGSFVVETPADGVTPTTFGEVIASLTSPQARVAFSFNGTTFDGIDTSFRVESVIAPVPLPAGGLLLGTALMGAAFVKRRKEKARA